MQTDDAQEFYHAVKAALNTGVDEVVADHTEPSIEIRCKDGQTLRLVAKPISKGIGLDVQFTRYWADLLAKS